MVSAATQPEDAFSEQTSVDASYHPATCEIKQISILLKKKNRLDFKREMAKRVIRNYNYGAPNRARLGEQGPSQPTGPVSASWARIGERARFSDQGTFIKLHAVSEA